jgi:hypothetical protein
VSLTVTAMRSPSSLAGLDVFSALGAAVPFVAMTDPVRDAALVLDMIISFYLRIY